MDPHQADDGVELVAKDARTSIDTKTGEDEGAATMKGKNGLLVSRKRDSEALDDRVYALTDQL